MDEGELEGLAEGEDIRVECERIPEDHDGEGFEMGSGTAAGAGTKVPVLRRRRDD